MKFSVGQKVRIKSLDWYNENTNEYGYIICDCVPFNTNMSIYCGKVLTIDDANEEFSYYKMKECEYVFTDEMIEGLVKKNVNIDVAVEETTKDISDKVTDIIVRQLMYGNSFNLPKGYILKDENGNVINATKIVLEKKKKEYPKTYGECCKILGCKADDFFTDFSYDHRDVEISDYEDKIDDLLQNFRKLRYCRDAYWKIYGKKMGLGKPWEPDFSSHEEKYSISVFDRRIVCIVNQYDNIILTFPTREMRDAFYENFKELIKQCKELL